MSVIEKMISFIKRLFKKEEIKLIEAPIEVEDEEKDKKKEKFLNYLKVEDAVNKKKKSKGKIETLICVGDGLGIQGKITS